jgi:hypothetical protein
MKPMPTATKYYAIKLSVLLGITIIAIAVITQIPPIPQDLAFHQFADIRVIAGIPNFWNVISNLGFIIVGIAGFRIVWLTPTTVPVQVTFWMLFFGVMLTGIGSAYYHWNPDNDRLVFDRIPMTIVFMSFLSAAIGQAFNKSWGVALLLPLLLLGVGSVMWWHTTEEMGVGDLRFYGMVQFLPMILIPLIFLLFPTEENRKIWPQFGWIIGWYVFAKILEHYDASILKLTHVISGHSLKHIAATVATIYFITVFKGANNLKNTSPVLLN